MIFGDPTLNVNPIGEPNVNIDIVFQEKGIYFGDQQLFPFFTPVVFGDATVKVSVNNKNQEIHNVLFCVNDELWFTDDTAPFETVVDKKAFGKQKINVVANYNIDESVSDQVYIWKFL